MPDLIDKKGLQHYTNKMVQANNRKVGNQPLPTVLDEIDTKIDEFKTLFEAEYSTPLEMKIENNANTFSVGTGLNNIAQIQKEEANNGKFTLLCNKQWSQKNVLGVVGGGLVEDNKTYTCVFNITKNTGSAPLTFNTTFSSLETVKGYAVGEVGKRIFKINITKRPEAIGRVFWFEFNNGTSEGYTGECEGTLMIFEGDIPEEQLPDNYFKGIKSIGELDNNTIEIKSCGKNLLNEKWKNKSSYDLGANDYYKAFKLGNFKKGYYVFSGLATETFDKELAIAGFLGVNGFDPNSGKGMYIKLFSDNTVNNNVNMYFEEDSVLYLTVYINGDFDNNFDKVFNKIKYMQLEITNSMTAIFSSYESYKENKIGYMLNAPLRSLPNGICDEIIDNKLIRRTIARTITINDVDIFAQANPNTKMSRINLRYAADQKPSKIGTAEVKIVCNKIRAGSNEHLHGSILEDRIGLTSDGYVRILLTPQTLGLAEDELISREKITAWFDKLGGSFDIVYELETPVIEYIESPTLQIWKNGTISIDSVIPAGTTHTASLNKSAQIKKNIEELTALKNRVQLLEELYDETALEQIHELKLLKQDMILNDKLK